MMMPGPLMPVKRPSVNITPRSYSFSTRRVLKTRNSSSRRTMIPNGMRVSG